MASTKIRISIPASLKIKPAERAALKKAFQAEAVRVLKRERVGAANEIINIIHGGGGSKKKPAKKKAAKKR